MRKVSKDRRQHTTQILVLVKAGAGSCSVRLLPTEEWTRPLLYFAHTQGR